MFIIRAFPNLTDDFLIAYRYAEAISKFFNVGIKFTNSDFPFPAIPTNYLDVFSSSVPHNSINLWFGPARNFNLSNYKNYAFLTTDHHLKPSCLFQMNKYFYLENMIFPIFEENQQEKSGILSYFWPNDESMLRETIEAWLYSKSSEPLKILAPYFSKKVIVDLIKYYRKQISKEEKIFVSTPQNASYEMIKNEIKKSKIILDLKKHKSISFSSVIALSIGIPCLTTSDVFPSGGYVINSKGYYINDKPGKLFNEKMSKYDISEIIQGINMLEHNSIIKKEDNLKSIFNLCSEMIKGD